ncbi:MAG: hypothetical protein ACK5KU_05430 [Beutenbergiaceae bacterium]
MKRLVFLLPGGLALLAGLDAALLLLGLPAPVTAQRLAEAHGPLLVLGFVGTLIALERAVAARAGIAYAAPALLGIGSLLTLTPLPLQWGQAMVLTGTVAMAVNYVPLWRRRREDAVLIQGVGAAMATGASALWLAGLPMPTLVPWLAAFVICTIGGERAELARVTFGGAGAMHAVMAATAALILSTPVALLWPTVGYPALGISLLALVWVLASRDIARHTITGTGLVRFAAACMLAGYLWLAVAGFIWLLAPHPTDGGAYDGAVHAIFLGFTMSMVMAHAPIILPAVLGIALPYRPVMVLAPALLNAALIVRMVGDARAEDLLRQIGGVGNIVALLTMVAVLVGTAVAGPQHTSEKNKKVAPA